MTASRPFVVEAHGVTREYRVGDAKIFAIKNLSLQIPKGEFAVLMGPSGCGKTTLLNLFGCIDTPTGGRLSVFGEDTSALTEKNRSRIRLRRVGFVFQRFFLLPMLTAFENVELPMIEAQVPKEERRDRVRMLLAQVGLAERMRHRPGQLSGGEMQRVAIARALANEPELIIADEPTGELDQATGQRIMELIKTLQDGGITVVMATHDPVAAQAGDVIHNLKDGQVA